MIYDTPTKAENYLVTRKTIYLPRYTRGRHNKGQAHQTAFTLAKADCEKNCRRAECLSLPFRDLRAIWLAQSCNSLLEERSWPCMSRIIICLQEKMIIICLREKRIIICLHDKRIIICLREKRIIICLREKRIIICLREKRIIICLREKSIIICLQENNSESMSRGH